MMTECMYINIVALSDERYVLYYLEFCVFSAGEIRQNLKAFFN